MEEIRSDIIQRDNNTTLPQFKLKMQAILDQKDTLPIMLIGATDEGTLAMTTGCAALEKIADDTLQKVIAHLETHA